MAIEKESQPQPFCYRIREVSVQNLSDAAVRTMVARHNDHTVSLITRHDRLVVENRILAEKLDALTQERALLEARLSRLEENFARILEETERLRAR